MKITLDITKLLEEGRITQREYDRFSQLSSKETGRITQLEYDRFSQLSSKETGSLAINILVVFGVLAILGGVIALNPSVLLVSILALVLMGIGLLIISLYQKQWGILGNILLLVGALMMAFSFIQYFKGGVIGFLFTTLLFIMIGIIVKSGLLMVLSALSIIPLMVIGLDMLGTGFLQNNTEFFIVVYGFLSSGAYFLSTVLQSEYEKLATVFSITSFIIGNIWFWIGSSIGGTIFPSSFDKEILAVLWAVILIAFGIWATKKNKIFLLNIVAFFGTVHFYTQWFQTFETEPVSILMAGVIAIVISIVLWKNKNFLFQEF